MKLTPLFMSGAIILSACGGGSGISTDPDFMDADNSAEFTTMDGVEADAVAIPADANDAEVGADTENTKPDTTETASNVTSAFTISDTSWKSDCETSLDGRSRSTLLQFTETDFVDRLEIYEGVDCQGDPVDAFGAAGRYQVTGNSTTASDGLSIFEVSFIDAQTAEPIAAVYYYIDLFANAIYPAFDEGRGLEIDYEQPLFRDTAEIN